MRSAARLVPGLELLESVYKLEWMEDPWSEIDRAGDWLLSLEAELKPDVIHLNEYSHGALAFVAPKVVVGHSCVLSWWEAVHRTAAPALWSTYRSRVRAGLNGADAVTAVSQSMWNALNHHYGLPGASHVVYNSRNPRDFQPAEKEQIVLSSGRLWDEAKNIRALDRAARWIQADVVVAGEEKHPDGGRASLTHARSLGKLDQESLSRWFARSAVYALPARYEPFGLSVLEAALSGCALVLGDIPSLREIWRESALFVPPDDHEALALAVNLLLARPWLRDSMARAARNRALSFTPERMLQGYLGLYAQAGSRQRAAKKGTTSCAS
jgi:glycosyltransferase involved in cell wall biosynthesis